MPNIFHTREPTNVRQTEHEDVKQDRTLLVRGGGGVNIEDGFNIINYSSEFGAVDHWGRGCASFGAF